MTMETKSSLTETKLIYGSERTPGRKNNNWRRKSLFETEESKQMKDSGSFVLTHADFPRRLRSWSHPLDLATPSFNRRVGVQAQDAKMVEDVIKKVLQEKIAKGGYDPKVCAQLSHDIADDIKENISEMKVPSGFEVICTCSIRTEEFKPHFFLESGYAWNDGVTTVARDKLAEYVYRNEDVVAVGTVYIADCKKVNANHRQRSRSLRVGSTTPIPE